MAYRLALAALVALRLAGASAQACSPGSYRCSAASGQGAGFLQCDVGGSEVQKTCGPGTVCYTTGSTILCNYPPANASPPASSGSPVVGGQCSVGAPADEYVCPGPSGEYDFFLRCLSGTYVYFACAPGTVCVKNDGQAMFCGMRGYNYGAGSAGPVAPSPSRSLAASSSGEASLSASDTTSSRGWDDATTGTASSTGRSGLWGSSDTEPPGYSTSAEASSSASADASSSAGSQSTSHSSPRPLFSGLFDNIPPLFPTSTEEGMSGMSSSTGSQSASSSSGGSFWDVTSPEASSESSKSGELYSTSSAEDALMSTGSSTVEPATSAAASSTSAPSAAATSPTATSATATAAAAPHPSNGLTGPLISGGLQMLLQNGASLPFTLPNIDLPAIDLATVHLPDMTFDGIALTAIPLPSITIPPMNPASLTSFPYIQEIMSRAGVTFDDLAKLPLPDLSHLDLSGLGHIDIGSVMSLMNVNRVPVLPSSVAVQDLAETLPAAAAAAPHTTTLGTDAIEGLLGLSIMPLSKTA
ncbi:hypothetical protein IWQ56_002962 [Coemansia nantahalensis]|nr:hypothetical protein IWQ56_002962 [Coemansia nantahalensis]